MKFRYHFQKVVDLKSNEKTQAEWMLSSAIGKLQTEEEHLMQLINDRNSLMDIIQSSAESCASASSLQELQRYAYHLDECISRKSSDVKHAQVNVQRNQTFLNGKVIDEKVWLGARDKAKIRFQQEMLLREQNDLDEMATVRFAAKAGRAN
ncbi:MULTISPECIES: flagellar export protein FliJ [Paenibacillus]|uniref:Flagellar FliJ protein n=2 Tax=Paenibacillus TaxID=44249 RepID=A0A2V4VQ03_PAEBA|nr:MULTISPECIES: flagellar export protein FliJ [Paenibacillus]MCK6074051.1 flagellar export protein FliJ [Paenibacillus silvae]MCK6148471.1 flagellar export protein FliJ [Paenibacillus silvae]MCK6266772.1 flagellar export protein FliJ [Paenibacillus silvae]PYE52199.1 flagellar FliJ protein [Paenibacillus barcinonensis]PZT56010.1 flagellar export protein FliJ [Paenibacillus silvae]